MSLTVVPQVDRAITPPPGDAASTTSTSYVDPALPVQAISAEDDKPSEPWTGLDLGGIKLRTLSTALFAFTHITSLYINHNALTNLPPSISRLRNLTLLDATGNELTSIPPEIGVLCKLKELLLFDNHISTLPLEIGTLYLLETLGVEGNPLEERYRKIIAEEGSLALINHFRDTCAIGPAPPERQWIEIDPDISSPTSAQQESFTTLSYNILCHHFAPQVNYLYTPGWALDWSYRKSLILEEIVNASADVVCLQEVETEQYHEFLYPQLKLHGYEGCHHPRSKARTMSPEQGKTVDGCAVFWKDER
jgi:CCR4-NOT transcription complex subunit 6